MAKTIALVLFMLMTTICVAQTAEKEQARQNYNVAIDTTKINLGQQVDQIAEALKKHTEGPLSVYYQAAVHKNRIVGGAFLGVGLFLFIVGLILCVLCLTVWFDSFDGPSPAIGVGVVMILVGAGVAFANFTAFTCPEYAAMNEVCDKIWRMLP